MQSSELNYGNSLRGKHSIVVENELFLKFILLCCITTLRRCLSIQTITILFLNIFTNNVNTRLYCKASNANNIMLLNHALHTLNYKNRGQYT